MTPAEAQALSVPVYMAFLERMDRERRELERQARAKKRR